MKFLVRLLQYETIAEASSRLQLLGGPGVQWVQVHPTARNNFWGLIQGGGVVSAPPSFRRARTDILEMVFGGILYGEYDDD